MVINVKKDEIIERYGKEAYVHWLMQNRARRAECSDERKASDKKWRGEHPEEVRANHQEQCRKGGKYYDNVQRYQRTGLQGERNLIRAGHRYFWSSYKRIIAPGSVLHHEWIPETSNYSGVALVERDAHIHGIIDVIKILKGKITLLTEEEIREQTIIRD